MPSPIVNATVQACILSATSNLIAQFITAHRSNVPLTINWTPVFHFMLYTIINTPANFQWQSFLESAFPSQYSVPSTSAVKAAALNDEKELDREEKTSEILESKLSIPNTITKFALDQTIGAVVNTLLFSLFFAGIRGENLIEAWGTAMEELWPLMSAGWKLWPAVSAVNFGFIRSVEGRSLVGSVAGLGWGIYLSLMAS